MATPYSNIYSLFLQKVSSYDLANLSSTDLSTLLQGYLKTSITKFRIKCNIPYSEILLTYDDTNQQFDSDLGDDDQEILSLFMVIEYLLPKINADELLRQGFTNREWNQTSQANQLKALVDLRNEIKNEIDSLVIQYSYNHTDMSTFQ